jgi:hypothetical protein
MNTFSSLFGEALGELAGVLSAIMSLMMLPGYYSVVLILGFWLFIAGKKARHSCGSTIDLNMDEFSNLRSHLSGIDLPQKGWLDKLRNPQHVSGLPAEDRGDIDDVLEAESKDSTNETASTDSDDDLENSEDNAESEADSSGSVENDDESDDEEGVEKGGKENERIKSGSSERYSRMSSQRHELKEFAWKIPIHDFPLYIMSSIIVIVLLLLPAFISTSSNDPLLSLVSSLFSTMMLPGFITKGLGLILTVTIYTILGAVAILVCSHLLFRWFQLEWLHLQPVSSTRFKRVYRIWTYCGIVNLYRLDQSTAFWLIPMLLMYIILIFILDVIAFYFQLDLHPTLLAAMHLLPITLPRMFDQLWPHPVVFKRQARAHNPECEPEELSEILMKDEYLGGLLGDRVIEEISTINIPKKNPLFRETEESNSRIKHLLNYQKREDLLPYLQLVLKHIFTNADSVVLTGPLGSGRREVILSTAFETVFHGNSCLVLVEDIKHARKVEKELNDFAKAFPALHAFKILRGGDPILYEVEALAKRVDVLVCDFESLNQVIGNAKYLHYFIDRLGLVALLDIDNLNLQEKAELPLMIRRLQLFCDTPGSSLPILAAILDAARADHDSFFKLFHRNFVQIPLGYSGDVRICFYRIPQVERSSLGPYSDKSVLMRFGNALMDAGYPIFYRDIGAINPADIGRKDQANGTTDPRELTGRSVIISLVQLSSTTYIEQLSRIRELGRLSSTGQHFCFLICDDDGWNNWLLQNLSTLAGYRDDTLTPQFIPSGEANNLIMYHMIRSVLEMGKVTLEQLRNAFGQRALLILLDKLKSGNPGATPSCVFSDAIRLIERVDDLPFGPHLQAIKHIETRLGRKRLDLDELRGHLIKLVCPELGIQKLVEAARQPIVYWPQRVFDFEGARARVSGKPLDGILNCIPEPENLRTTKIRRLDIDVGQNLDLTDDHLFNRSGIGICSTELDITERISGYRTWRGSSLVLETVYNPELQVECKYRAQAVVIFLPGLTPDAAHLFAHLLRHYLMLILGQADELFDVAHGCFEPFSVAVNENKYHDVTLVEYIEGGIGIAEMITPVLLHKMAVFISELDTSNVAWWSVSNCHCTKLTRFDDVHSNSSDIVWDGTTAELLFEFLKTNILALGKDESVEELSFDNIVWWHETNSKPTEKDQSEGSSEVEDQPVVSDPGLLEQVTAAAELWKALEHTVEKNNE